MVWPSLVFCNLVDLVLFLKLLDHLLLSGFEFHFVCVHHFCVLCLLNCPSLLDHPLLFVHCLLVSSLLESRCFYFLNLVWSKSLEVIGNVPVSSKLGGSCVSIFGHNVTVIGVCNFELVLLFLVISPLGLSVSLFTSKSLVFLLHFLHHFISLVGVFVFKKSSHSSQSFGLLGVHAINS
jgi:hypothetical protein